MKNINSYRLHRILTRIIVISVLVVSGYACKTIAPVIAEREYYTGKEIYEKLNLNDADVETYSAGRLNLTINDAGENMNIRGAVRIHKDSAIMVSFNAIAGIEAARMLLTMDTIKFIDRINNMYFIGDYNDSQKLFPVKLDFYLIQNMILGSAYRLFNDLEILEQEGTRYLLDNNRMAVNYSGFILPSEHGKIYEDSLRIILDNEFRIRDLEMYSENNDIYTRLKFNSFADAGGFFFPDDIDIHYLSGNMPFHANMRLSRIEINRKLNFPFTIPSRYNSF